MRKTRAQLDLAAGSEAPPIVAPPAKDEQAWMDARHRHATALIRMAHRARRLKNDPVYHRWGERSSAHLDSLAAICEVLAELVGNRRYV